MELLQLNLRDILRHRLPDGKGKLVPGFVYSLLEKIICQDELNAILRHAWPATGSAFSRAVLEYLNLTVTTTGLDALPADRPYVFASNHPLGGLDGIALIAVVGSRFGDGSIRFMVNDMLMNVTPLADVFLPVNKYGAQGREAAMAISEAFANPAIQIGAFPAGLVSRLGDTGEVADLKWQKAFAAKAIEYGREVVPVRFDGLNRRRFYRLARLRKKLGLKINLEQVLLPSELCAKRDHTLRIIFGSPIPLQNETPVTLARKTREAVYALLPPDRL
ncbi:MAG: 1-acyl-sn-glycerol-3-phosphate acyltransferase [Muribaculaceae bacterium]|nr:1-acyl-sn-glycerol-3-phosphate acyltransferase [Muribaculaceae bacterium]